MNDNFKIISGNSLEVLDTLEENSVGSIVTDPPYELGFMGKSWDASGIAYNVELWKKALRVLKPGGYLLAFGGTRTYHRICCAIEDAGFEIRDCIMWLYGCLSEDTEVLTQNGFKRFHKITDDDIIRIYDIENGIYKWEKPKRWNVYQVNQDTCYRIKSNNTDQLVSRNHRCLVEQNGKLVFKFAEQLNDLERVPVLSYDIPYLQKERTQVLFPKLLWQSEELASQILCERERKEKSEKGNENGKKSCLERRCNLSQKKRKLCLSKYKICKVSTRVYNNGEKRWLCNGTSFESSNSNSTTTFENRMCPSQGPQCGKQCFREFDVVCDESRPQTIRGWKTYKTTLATITKEKYTGIIYCPTVSTGCFVARRKGKVFITGNSGFPKSMNIGLAIDKKLGIESIDTGIVSPNARPNCDKSNTLYESGTVGKEFTIKKANNKWDGWGTCLKPAYEPIIVARKPFKGNLVDNILENGVGGINIDECRVETNDIRGGGYENRNEGSQGTLGWITQKKKYTDGRFPANVIHDGSEEVTSGMPENTVSSGGKGEASMNFNQYNGGYKKGFVCETLGGYGDSGSAARYFYCAKASSKDRDEGLDFLEEKNIHPTVKPVDLMQYLVRLVTPKGETVLDIFNGSGSTGKAVAFENREREANYKYIGIELDPEYCKISEARIDYALNKYEYDMIQDIKKEERETGQLSLFDFTNE